MNRDTRNALTVFAILSGSLGLLALFFSLINIAATITPTEGQYAEVGVGAIFLVFSIALILIVEFFREPEPEGPPPPPPVILGVHPMFLPPPPPP